MNKSSRLGALIYHDVTDSPAASGFPGGDADRYKLSLSLYRAHLDEIASTRRPVLAPRSLSDSLPRDAVILTFDDGGESAHSAIAPLLEARGWRGIFFIVTDRVGQDGFLSRKQIEDLHRRGHVIGSHSHTHPVRFSALPDARLDDEWNRSREILESITGAPVLTASVPGGYYSLRVARAAERAGYQILYNSEPRSRPSTIGNLRVVGRFGIQRDTTAREAGALAAGRGLARLKQSLIWNAKKPLKAIGGPLWIAFRKWALNRGPDAPSDRAR